MTAKPHDMECSPPIVVEDLPAEVRPAFEQLVGAKQGRVGCYYRRDGEEVHLFSCRNHLLPCGLEQEPSR